MAESTKGVPARLCPEMHDIPVSDIHIKENIRKDYDGVNELAANIRQYGLQQPITVYYLQGEGYIVKMGHRRFLACQKLCAEEPGIFNNIRCIVSDPNNTVMMQLIENVQRQNLSQKELYEALVSLRDQNMTLKQIADVMGKTEKTIKNLFVGINELTAGRELLNFLDSPAGGTIEDIAETKGIPDKQARLDLLRQRQTGAITRAGLRRKARELKQAPDTGADNRDTLLVSTSSDKIIITEKTTSSGVLMGKFRKMASKLIRYLQADDCPYKVIVEQEK
jgi:ParB family chromosome partitioning protein